MNKNKTDVIENQVLFIHTFNHQYIFNYIYQMDKKSEIDPLPRSIPFTGLFYEKEIQTYTYENKLY